MLLVAKNIISDSNLFFYLYNFSQSTTFEYNSTENPAKVIFVSPTANENGFYDGGWHIDHKAPKFFRFTKPERE